ncbi:YifB family Mg chelatase-like AAA ATPase [Actinotalea sp. M2MS4P-6]|uniref:YifB family Mg chelatase-like AAA ATPase n=1 Tax=Actinotalea sp. M2MS4P-6 TaxID=2983762 RepID=UPI0021E38836|nr:YifB family Mg chelatase-like AAA ATPase [Actinotalea sp. M2MS4P-6]MCV2396094.1 YifB family Mg chelatase-like AAA ATPase [Actinotalea sp. M2MS4P-6]
MSLGRTRAVALVGLTGHVVDVEAHLAASVPGLALVGLPDAALSEARDRVRAAVASTGLAWPQRKITINLSPASLPKAGAGFDLAIAVATLAGAGLCPAEVVTDVVHLGELGLDGRLRPVRGVLPAVAAAVSAGYRRVVVPAADLGEAQLVPGADVVGAASLAEVLAVHGAEVCVPDLVPVRRTEPETAKAGQGGDLADVVGQGLPRHALEVAAAGGHHLLMLGPPGTGKTMLAARLPGLLPDLDDHDAVEVTSVHSVAGTFRAADGLLRRPPFEDPHHTATPAAVIGGGSGLPRPGAASRAHRGVLFLDEAPEFSPRVLQTLRQPLEHGELVLHRAAGSARYPARFQLVMAANPCPCGNSVGMGLTCTCSSIERRRYFSRLSGPLLDRVDLQIDVLPVTRVERLAGPGEPTAAVAERVAQARARAQHRLAGTGWRTNAEVSGRWLRAHAPRDAATAMRGLEVAIDRGELSLRGADRVLRIAWTLADLAAVAQPGPDQVGEALVLRGNR